MLCSRCTLPVLALYLLLEEVSAAVVPSRGRDKRVKACTRRGPIVLINQIKPVVYWFIDNVMFFSTGGELAGPGAPLPPAWPHTRGRPLCGGCRGGRRGCGCSTLSFRDFPRSQLTNSLANTIASTNVKPTRRGKDGNSFMEFDWV